MADKILPLEEMFDFLSILFLNPAKTTSFHFQNIEIIIHKQEPSLYGGTTGKLPLPGVSLIKKFENFFPNAYVDPGTLSRPITIGWGSTIKGDGSLWKLGDHISREEADRLLIYQLEHDYLPALQQIPGWEKLTARQRGALLSFSYNVGADFYGDPRFHSITKVLDWRDWKHFRRTLLMYRNPGTRVEAGLKLRRQTEAWVFLQGD